MIYSVNFIDMTEKLNPLAVSKYLDEMGWTQFPYKREDIKIYQFEKDKLTEKHSNDSSICQYCKVNTSSNGGNSSGNKHLYP